MNILKWTDPNLTLPTKVAECFQGLPERIHVPEGTEIYRLRTNRQDVVGNAIWESPWWFPKNTYNQIVGRGARTGMGVKVSARSGLAVPSRFNPDFDNLVIMSLLRSGFAWAGKAAPQKWSETFQVQLSGGFEQWWLPGLDQIDLRFKYFGWPE
jgi:hypothetical protein